MSPETLAYLYVYYIEPTTRVLAWVALLVAVLYVLNMLTDGKKKGEIINMLFNLMVKGTKTVFLVGGKSILIATKMLLRTLTVLIDTVRDFFTSKI